MIFVGVDPGISGALAVLDGDTNEVIFHDAPVLQVKVGKNLRNVMDAAKMSLMLQSISAGRECVVTIEKVQAMPGRGPDGESRSMGATSAFSFGMGYGMWLGVLAALCIPHEQVHPMTWKSALMKGFGKEKDASRQRAMEMFPRTAKDLARKKDHGRADALLLAVYGKRCHENPMRILKREELPMDRTLFG